MTRNGTQATSRTIYCGRQRGDDKRCPRVVGALVVENAKMRVVIANPAPADEGQPARPGERWHLPCHNRCGADYELSLHQLGPLLALERDIVLAVDQVGPSGRSPRAVPA